MVTDVQARKVKPDGNAGVGKWIFRFVSPITSERRDMGLGRYPEISIRDTRVATLECRRLIGNGTDPLEARRHQKEKC